MVIDDLHASTTIDKETHKRLSLENQRLFPASGEDDAEDEQDGADKVEEQEEREDVIEALRNYLEKRHNNCNTPAATPLTIPSEPHDITDITEDAAIAKQPASHDADTVDDAGIALPVESNVPTSDASSDDMTARDDSSVPTAVPVHAPVSFTSLLTQALETQRVSSAITRYRVVGDHVMYEIRLQVARSDPSSSSCLMHMMLLRRYSDFAALHSTLTKYGHCPGDLPPRQLMPQFRYLNTLSPQIYKH